MSVKGIKKYSKEEYIEMVGNAVNKATMGKCLIIFFGSILTNKFNRTSDIDVGIYCGKKLTGRAYTRILEEIDKLPILREVDIVDIANIKDREFLKNVLKGKIWKNIPELMNDLKNRIKNSKK